MSRNEVREIASKIVDDNTVIGKPGWFVTYAVIEWDYIGYCRR